MQDNELTNDLDWLAFCYIADELNEEQRDAFEMRLADDQQARDSVVQAMERSQLLLVALADVNAPTATIQLERRNSHQISSRLASRLLAFASALLLMTTGMIWLANSDHMNSYHPPLAQQHSASFDAENLAFAWADSLNEISDVDFESPADEDSGFANPVADRAEDWMIFALEDLKDAEDPIRSKEGN